MTYLFLAVLACTIALGGWLIVRTDVDLPFHRLSARRDPAAADRAARAFSPPAGAGRTSRHPASADEPAQLNQHPGVGHQK
jgi:hypothetical protein